MLEHEEIRQAIAIEFNPIRVRIHRAWQRTLTPVIIRVSNCPLFGPQVGFVGEDGPFELLTKDILNLGVFPSVLVSKAKDRFVAAGGVVRDMTSVQGIRVTPNGAALELPGGQAE